MILILVASLNENVNLANQIKNELNNKSVDSKIINLVDLNLPIYDTSKEQNDGIPQIALDLAKDMEIATAYVVVSPEYNFSVSPVLVNTIAWVSRIGDDFRKLFDSRAIQLATHSGGNGVDLLNGLRVQFTKLGANVMTKEILTTYQNKCDDVTLENIFVEFINNIKK